MSIRTRHPALGLYFVVALGALVLYLPNSGDAEAAELLLIDMVVITFPSGFLVAVVLALGSQLLEQIGLTASFGVVGQLLMWALFLGVGFLQWQYIAPWIIRKLQTHSNP
jgi:hypothetical protein